MSRRSRFLAGIAVLGIAAVVGGVLAGFLLRARDDVGVVPSSTASSSVDPQSESSESSSTASGTATPTPSPSPSPSPSPTETAVPSATPSATSQPTRTPAPTPTPDIIEWQAVADGPDVYAGGISDSAVGADGRLYSFFWGGHVPNRGRETGHVPILVFDPTNGSVEFRNPALESFETIAQAVTGNDGLIYFFVWRADDMTSVRAYDPETDRFVPEAEVNIPIVVWDAAAVDGRIYLTAQFHSASPREIHSYDPASQSTTLVATHEIEHQAMIANLDGELVFIGPDGTFAFDVRDRSLRQVAPAHEWDVLSKRAEAAGPRDTLLVADRGVAWYHDGNEWHHAPFPERAEVLSFLDSRWLMITVEPTAQAGPLVVRYWQADQVER